MSDAYTHSPPQVYGNTADGDDECHFANKKCQAVCQLASEPIFISKKQTKGRLATFLSGALSRPNPNAEIVQPQIVSRQAVVARSSVFVVDPLTRV
jgi:hypothetical protein